MNRWKRWLLKAAGMLSLALAVVGIILPGLPTTPLVLLAAWCFAKASPQLHTWLLNHRQLGKLVRDWETHRSIPLKVKWVATALMSFMVLLSAWQLQELPWLAGLVVVMGMVGAWVVWRFPTRHSQNP
jgi:uncharacterized membrane protein YbaN (DUF454 family)